MAGRVFPLPIRDFSVYRRADDDKVLVLPVDHKLPEGEFSYWYSIREYSSETPWSLWHAWALEDGVPQELADLGRAVIQHADPHSFLREVCFEFGGRDSGASMIRFALEESEAARETWPELLTRNGLWPSHIVVN